MSWVKSALLMSIKTCDFCIIWLFQVCWTKNIQQVVHFKYIQKKTYVVGHYRSCGIYKTPFTTWNWQSSDQQWILIDSLPVKHFHIFGEAIHVHYPPNPLANTQLLQPSNTRYNLNYNKVGPYKLQMEFWPPTNSFFSPQLPIYFRPCIGVKMPPYITGSGAGSNKETWGITTSHHTFSHLLSFIFPCFGSFLPVVFQACCASGLEANGWVFFWMDNSSNGWVQRGKWLRVKWGERTCLPSIY